MSTYQLYVFTDGTSKQSSLLADNRTYLLLMRVGVISDIHANGVALDAVFADVAHHPVDEWVCLGDAVQGGVQPLEVAERLAELGCPVILGNADAFVLESTSAETVADPQHSGDMDSRYSRPARHGPRALLRPDL